MTNERRRFKRLPIPEGTIAMDAANHQLGRVTLVGGGGIQLEDVTPEGERQLQPGGRLTITIVEPAIGAHHSAEVEVKYREGSRAGLEFISGTAATAH